ncbi:ABC transporter permease [Actinomadura sp. NTSP31]|uniref:ABC transporter permease n=1 Tax=Actinomadura sp. NTSP31 TaxID=1735447 RepID=UPI0035C1ED34
MSRALRAEWTKLRTVPSTNWLLLAVVTATVALGLVADAAARCPSAGCHLDPARTGLTGIYLGQAIVVVLAVPAVSGEYGNGMIHVTFTAMPGRTVVLAAKAVTVTGATLSAGVPAVLGSLLAGRLVLPGHGFTAAHGLPPLSPTDGPVLRAAVGSVLYLGLIALLSVGVAAAVRDAATAIGTVLGLLYLLPILTTVLGGSGLARHFRQLSPMTAGLAVQATTDLRGMPIAPWAGLGVLAGWAAAALLAGGLLLHLRDA